VRSTPKQEHQALVLPKDDPNDKCNKKCNEVYPEYSTLSELATLKERELLQVRLPTNYTWDRRISNNQQ
jgi:hypothetical protein